MSVKHEQVPIEQTGLQFLWAHNRAIKADIMEEEDGVLNFTL